MVGGIYSRATCVTLNNIFNPQKGKTNMLKSAFDPNAMLFDGVIGGVIGGLTIPKYIKKSTKTSSIKNTANKNKSNPSCNGTTPKAQSGSTQSLENNLLNNTDEILEGGLKIDVNVKPTVTNEKLKNIVNDLYKGQGGANTIGNGTTMDAVRNEILTGQATNGKFHTSKLNDYVNALEKRLRAGDLNPNDEAVVKTLLEDAKNALSGK